MADARDAWLTTQCSGDEALLAEVRSLLAAQATPDSQHFDHGVAQLLPPLLDDEDALINTRIGPDRLLRLLGEGGMGRVFLAERADGLFRQHVALKLMRPGFESSELHQRFLRERDLLARLTTDRQNLTLALRNLGRYDEALDQARVSVAIDEKILGPQHPDLSRALFTLDTTLYHMAH